MYVLHEFVRCSLRRHHALDALRRYLPEHFGDVNDLCFDSVWDRSVYSSRIGPYAGSVRFPLAWGLKLELGYTYQECKRGWETLLRINLSEVFTHERASLSPYAAIAVAIGRARLTRSTKPKIGVRKSKLPIRLPVPRQVEPVRRNREWRSIVHIGTSRSNHRVHLSTTDSTQHTACTRREKMSSYIPLYARHHWLQFQTP